MDATEPRMVWIHDLPVCLPGRACVDQSPVAAPLMHATSVLTPFSPLIAVAYVTVTLGAFLAAVICVNRWLRGRALPGGW